MLHEDWESRLRNADPVGFMDPCLRGRRALLRLAVRFYKCNMLLGLRRRRAGTKMFTVVKNILTAADGRITKERVRELWIQVVASQNTEVLGFKVSDIFRKFC